jgi:hypothetical protein
LKTLYELILGLSIERLRVSPVAEPRQIVGSLQQRHWTMRIQPADDLISDNTQQDGQ